MAEFNLVGELLSEHDPVGRYLQQRSGVEAVARAQALEANGTVRLPRPVAQEWGYEQGGMVHVVNVDDIAVITPAQVEKRPAVQAALEQGALSDYRRVASPVPRFSMPVPIRDLWEVPLGFTTQMDVVDTVNEVMFMPRGGVERALRGLLPTLTGHQVKKLTGEVFQNYSRDHSALRMMAATHLVKRAFPQVYGE
jgi:hypothetical protein